MDAKWGEFSHQGHIAWAFSSLCIASLAALAVGASGFWQDGCFACAPVGPATCVGPEYSHECSDMIALGAVFVTILTGLCLLFSTHASRAFRMKRGWPLDSWLFRSGRSRSTLLQILGLTLLSEGIELAAVGLLTPIQFFSFHGGCEGCPIVWSYSLWGLATGLVGLGAGAAVLGSVLVVFGFPRSRTRPRAPVPNPSDQ